MFKSLLKPILSFSLVLFVGCGIGCTAAAGAAPVISPKAKLSMKDKVLIERYMRQWSAADPEVQKSIHLGLRNLAGKKRLQSVKDEQLMELNLLPPTPAFIATIAARYNIEYDFNRKGTDIFYGKKGEPIYPSNNGFIGEPELADIEPNKVLLDRFGAPRGSFVAFYGASFSSRALNKYDAEDLRLGKKEYHIYKINNY